VDSGLSLRREDGLELSADPARIDLDRVHAWLANEAYWALGRDRDVVERSIAASLVAGVYDGAEQLAFARIVTDRATFAWLCDVFVDRSARGRGIGTWMVGALAQHLREFGIYRLLLATKDAHGVYASAGFTPLAVPSMYMECDTRNR
jgi:GNAT superfamily N-acetyltransferase